MTVTPEKMIMPVKPLASRAPPIGPQLSALSGGKKHQVSH